MASEESLHLSAGIIQTRANKDDLPGLFQSKVGIRAVDYKALDQTKCVGKGATGTVYRATFEGREVALKTFIRADIEKFQKETLIFAGLSHPNVAEFYAYAVNKRKCSIVMEFMDGDLHFLIEKRMDCPESEHRPPFSIPETVDVIHQVAEGMNYLHEKKIVHRDLKSTNILFKMDDGKSKSGTGYLQVKVADFGLSKTRDKSTTNSNLTPNLGTERWMPPELIQLPNMDGQACTSYENSMNYPFKCDVYSFAMVCFEILTGEVPFQTVKKTEVLEMVLNGDRPDLPDHCPPELNALIQECWNQEPGKRPCFAVICEELKNLKGLLLAGSTSSQGPLPAIQGGAINDTFSSSELNDDPSHAREHGFLESEHVESEKYDLAYVQGRALLCEVILETIEQRRPSLNSRVVGLYGVGGYCKTTVCKVLCNKYKESHGAVCYLSLECKSRRELLQEALRKLTDTTHLALNALDEDKCMELLKRDIQKQKVFLAIDGVDTPSAMEQAKDFLRVVYAAGSTVLVAARSLDQLQSLNMHESDCLKMPKLNDDEAVVSLVELYLSGCSMLQELPNLLNLTSLRKIVITGCQSIQELRGLGHLVALQELDFSGCPMLRDLPKLLQLTNLRKLILTGCQFIEALRGLGDLVALQELDLSGCLMLQGLPYLGKLRHLRKLDVTGCCLIRALPGVGDLVSLQELRVSSFELIVCDIGKLRNLRVLIINSESILP